jgi:hypothetical protein
MTKAPKWGLFSDETKLAREITNQTDCSIDQGHKHYEQPDSRRGDNQLELLIPLVIRR